MKKLHFFCFLGLFTALYCNSSNFLDAAPKHVVRRISPLNDSEASAAISDFKGQSLCDYAFSFDLSTNIGQTSKKDAGYLFFAQIDQTPYFRADFDEHRFLLKGGSAPECLRYSVKTGNLEPFPENQDMLDGHHCTPRDILMTFLNGERLESKGVLRVQGRYTHTIRIKQFPQKVDFIPKPEVGLKENREPSYVEVALDPWFQAILRVQYFNQKEELIRNFTLLNFKKIKNTWIMKTVEIKDPKEGISTRFTVNKAAVEQILPRGIFNRDALISSAGTVSLSYLDC